jgi:hypothetical protein
MRDGLLVEDLRIRRDSASLARPSLAEGKALLDAVEILTQDKPLEKLAEARQ